MHQQPIPLDPSELVVTSFETEATAAALSPITVLTINDPTAATRCFICPAITYNCF
ncbi:MAG TPA: hypothetical protein VFJ16_26700 [Longimicrobium sp.]|nr:hypothetical protein [Longimicrobium sp.]